jgi:hypothetical protein
MADANTWLREIVKYLVAGNTALPIILSTVDSVALLVRAATDSGPSVQERAEIIRSVVAENAAYGEAEVARLERLIAAQSEQG